MSKLMPGYRFCALTQDDIDQVLKIEQQVYAHPWTRGNFVDSLSAGHEMCGLRDAGQDLVGYFLAMLVVDEVHLLNLAVSAEQQGRGFSRVLMDQLCAYAREQKAESILLEVRVRNTRAIQVYQHYGFTEIGRRKAYYPAEDTTREDAIVMRMAL
ncbi:ribosomal protein S18-alanine N-acetyltransferase [Undibacterium sp.]|jgi:ribosomal-protein-alanine N-acetyltransferase|uniref:ribosomal protein S18-alanine N-acetyltransferase n=1 Tax=Undibacterium sp. TaxID=1914977 RepID=UPI002BCC1493|nr:ribosomal protein S18-alanine N-acetyltransferase [Undibacterium sp.]HTD03546.1 ribosomal protein S18-alanine N-acetyltransferase [Undibacterium sp.]